MPGELAALSALVVAEPTFVRLFPGVASTMDRQIGTVLEHLQTRMLRKTLKYYSIVIPNS